MKRFCFLFFMKTLDRLLYGISERIFVIAISSDFLVLFCFHVFQIAWLLFIRVFDRKNGRVTYKFNQCILRSSINEAFNESAFFKSVLSTTHYSILMLIIMMIMWGFKYSFSWYIEYIWVNLWFVVELSLSNALNEKCLCFIKLFKCVNRCKL